MKKGANTLFIAAAAAVMTAAYHAPAPKQEKAPEIQSAPVTSPRRTASSKTVDTDQVSPCRAYRDAQEGDADSSSYGDGLKVWNKFTQKSPEPDMRYVIALAPDPVHTRLSLYFDRTMEAIQAAAQDETYVYDSSWLPWQLDSKDYPVRADENAEEDAAEAREGCPGMILFRRRGREGEAPAYSQGMAVFVVADEPTQGVNPSEWNEAIRVIAGQARPHETTLSVLGPTFSGSLPSLARLVGEGSLFQRSNFQAATIYSGAVSSCGAITRFIRTTAQANGPPISFGAFSENSELEIYRLLNHYELKGQKLTDVAIVSEDETAYGQSDAEHGAAPQGGTDQTGKKGIAGEAGGNPCAYDYGTSNVPVWLFYPRDISAMRAAYMEQSIFSKQRQEGGENLSMRRVLHPTAPVESTSATDTIMHYSQGEVPLDEEARLYELVSFLRSHHTHYLVLRGTNPDDLLFLTRFFHHSYPGGRIILLHSDEMLRREIDTSEFRGVMLLTNYPLLPREQHWTRLIGRNLDGKVDRHVHRIFAADTIQGEYLAARFLFDVKPGPVRHDSFALYRETFKENLPDYAEPIWFHYGSPSSDDELCHGSKPPCYRLPDQYVSPPTWLVTVGRDGSWPIAVLTGEPDKYHLDNPAKAPHPPPPSTITKLSLHTADPSGSATPSASHLAVYYWSGSSGSSPMPWRISLLAILAFALVHSFGIWIGLDPSRAPHAIGFRELILLFRPRPHPRASLLLGIGTGIVFCAALLLLFGPLRYHGLWDLNYGESLYWFAGLFLLLLAAVAVALYRSAEHRRVALPAFCGLVVVWGAIVAFFTAQDAGNDQFSLLYRSAHITNGVSPLLPLLLILGGLYFSTMLSLRELDLLTTAPVRLPRSQEGTAQPGSSKETAAEPASSEQTSEATQPLTDEEVEKEDGEETEAELVPCGQTPEEASLLTAAEKAGSGAIPKQFARICMQFGNRIAAYVTPVSGELSILVPPVAIAAAALWLFHDEGGTLTLEGPRYSFTLLCSLMLVGVVAMNHALNLHRCWSAMRLMLRALGREPLRRTFAAMRSSPDSSIWALGSGARGEQMRALSNEVESLTHLRNLLQVQATDQAANKDSIATASLISNAIRNTLCWAEKFKESYVTDALPSEQDEVRGRFCAWLGRTVEDVFNWILIPAWSREKTSLNLGAAGKSGDDGTEESEAAKAAAHLNDDPVVRAAEEFVCQVYVAYTKKTLSCMRSSAKSVAVLFLSLGAAVSCYPILSRTTVVTALLIIVIAVFIMVARVYMEMARDEILSLMTGTKPGELGSEFWLKLLAFGVGPLAGVIAALFPSVAETIFSVLGPSLDMMK